MAEPTACTLWTTSTSETVQELLAGEFATWGAWFSLQPRPARQRIRQPTFGEVPAAGLVIEQNVSIEEATLWGAAWQLTLARTNGLTRIALWSQSHQPIEGQLAEVKLFDDASRSDTELSREQRKMQFNRAAGWQTVWGYSIDQNLKWFCIAGSVNSQPSV